MVADNGHRIIRKGSLLDILIRLLPIGIGYYHQVRIGYDCHTYFQFSWKRPIPLTKKTFIPLDVKQKKALSDSRCDVKR